MDIHFDGRGGIMKQTFENFLMEKHAEEYTGTKDCMIDNCNDWLCDLGPDDYLKYGDEFAEKKQKDFRKKALSQIQGMIDWLNCW